MKHSLQRSVANAKQKKNTMNKVINDTLKLHSVLVCQDCKTVWNRDVNTANSIYSLATHIMNNNPRSSIFSHQGSTSPTPILR
ncbi:hypothetical protein BC941DRAFT_54298 [Chlamydoabsidia padenii]|nr:hypothetical protein BC941DRAFT_54298 [Chlamydoabsidia padenii]